MNVDRFTNSRTFLNYLAKEYKDNSGDDFLCFTPWDENGKPSIEIPTSLNVDLSNLKKIVEANSAVDVICKMYDEDDELLLYLLYSQILYDNSNIKEVYQYNRLDEDEEITEDYEYFLLTDVKAYILRTKNKLFVFEFWTEAVISDMLDLSKNNELSSFMIEIFQKITGKQFVTLEDASKIIEEHYS